MIKSDARECIQTFLDIVEAYSIRNMPFLNMPPINWGDYRKGILTEFEALQSPSIDDIDQFIRDGLDKLEDGHSGLLSTDKRGNYSLQPNIRPTGRMIGTTAYICTQTFSVAPETNILHAPECVQHAQDLQTIIANMDQNNPTGWIVDLRINHGGNFWPMMVGLGPLLGDGIHGYFMGHNDAGTNNIVSSWGYTDGKVMHDGETTDAILSAYRLKIPKPPIAVLTGEGTNSSGEIICIAFKGLDNVKSFGDKTKGASTSNIMFEIAPLKTIALTTHAVADRNLNTYGYKIEPDFESPKKFKTLNIKQLKEPEYQPESDPLIIKAIDWIAVTQPLRQYTYRLPTFDL